MHEDEGDVALGCGVNAGAPETNPRARRRGWWQVARTAAESAVPERPGLAPASLGGGPPVAGEDPGRPFPGRSLTPALSSPVEGQGPRARK